MLDEGLKAQLKFVVNFHKLVWDVRATLFEKFNQFETKRIDMKHEQLQNQSTTSPEYGHDFLDERTNPIFKSEGQC
jgi:hypothetical protein